MDSDDRSNAASSSDNSSEVRHAARKLLREKKELQRLIIEGQKLQVEEAQLEYEDANAKSTRGSNTSLAASVQAASPKATGSKFDVTRSPMTVEDRVQLYRDSLPSDDALGYGADNLFDGAFSSVPPLIDLDVSLAIPAETGSRQGETNTGDGFADSGGATVHNTFIQNDCIINPQVNIDANIQQIANFAVVTAQHETMVTNLLAGNHVQYTYTEHRERTSCKHSEPCTLPNSFRANDRHRYGKSSQSGGRNVPRRE